jgi:hypothetical protein
MTATDTSTPTVTDSPDQYYRVSETQKILRMGKTTLYQEMRSGRLGSIKRGRCRIIPATAIAAYQSLLAAEAKELGW